jgi:hypothetical protein
MMLSGNWPDYETYSELFHISKHDIPMPSVDVVKGDKMELIRSVIFPGYFRNSEINNRHSSLLH